MYIAIWLLAAALILLIWAQYLKSSILLIKNNFIRNLYMFYLKLSKPISTLYIVENTIDMEIVANKLVNKETVTGYKQYNPKKN